jgi:voltage-gated potassium channel Kch
MSWKKSVSDYVRGLGESRNQYRALLLLLVGIATLVLGYLGFCKEYPDHFYPLDLSLLYRSGELFAYKGGEHLVPGNWELEVARWLAPGVTLVTLYEFIKTLLFERFQSVRLKFVRWHVIVCGLGLLGPEIVARFRQRGVDVVVIEKDPENPNLAAARKLGAITLVGDGTDPSLLRKARVTRAWYLFAVTGNDGTNSEIAVAAHRLADQGGAGGLTCFVHIVDTSLCALLREHQIAMDDDRFTLELFNIYQMAGLTVLKEHPPFPAQATPPDVHVLVIGAGRMGQNLIYHVAKSWRDTWGNAKKKIRVTIVDREAVKKVEALQIHYPSIGHYCDFGTVQADLNSIEFQSGRFLFEGGRVSVTAIYVCMNDQSVGLAAALELNQRLQDFAIRHCVDKPAVPIVVRTGKEGLTALFNDMRGTSGSFGNISSFPMVDRSCGIDNITGGLNDTIARAIHEDYLRNQIMAGQTPETNKSVKPWEKLEEMLKESNRNQAVHIRDKLRSIGCDIVGFYDWEETRFTFRPEEIETLAEGEHQRFVDERLRMGWKPGPAKDAVKKTSPFLVPYADLEEKIKELDRSAVRALPAVLARADLRIVRLPKPGQSVSAREIEAACAGR